MTTQKMITEISRKAGGLEVVQSTRSINAGVKSVHSIRGIYMLDESIEILIEDGICLALEKNRYLDFKKVGFNMYRISNRKINLLIRPKE